MNRVFAASALVVLAGCTSAPPPPPFAAKLLRNDEVGLTAMAASGDGTLVATVDATNEATVWGVDDEKRFPPAATDARVVAFSPDPEPKLAIACVDGTVKLADKFLASETAAVFAWRLLQGPREPVGQLRFSPDGRRLVAWAKDASVWDVKSEKLLAHIEGPVVAVSPDARWVLVRRAGVALVDARSGLAPWMTGEPAAAAAFSEDGALVALGLAGGVVELRDAATGTVLARRGGFAGAVSTLVFSPDKRLLIAGGEDDVSHQLLDAGKLDLVRTLRWQNGEHVFSPDSQKVVSLIRLDWAVVSDVKTGRELGEFWVGSRATGDETIGDSLRDANETMRDLEQRFERERLARLRAGRHVGPALVFSRDGRFLSVETTYVTFIDAVAWKRLTVVEGSDVTFAKDSKRAIWLRAPDGIVCVGDSPH